MACSVLCLAVAAAFVRWPEGVQRFESAWRERHDAQFARARADALDCDTSDLVVRNSACPKIVDDGVELMTTHAFVVDCDGGPSPRKRQPIPFLAEPGSMQSLSGRAWDEVRVDVRGGRR